jgi:hypothetical protein
MYIVDVIAKTVEGQRALVPRCEFETLYQVRSWAGAHGAAFRDWLVGDETDVEIFVYDDDERSEPALYIRFPRELKVDESGRIIPNGEVLGRVQLRAMKKTALKQLREERRAKKLTPPPASSKPVVSHVRSIEHMNGTTPPSEQSADGIPIV